MYEKALVIRDLIEQHKEQITMLEKMLREFKQPTPIYKYTVYEMEAELEDKFFQYPAGIRIIGEIQNKKEMDLFLTSVGFCNDYKDTRRSVLYHRTEENVLAHKGGGYLLLKESCIVSDEDWTEIKKGNFEKFMPTKNC